MGEQATEKAPVAQLDRASGFEPEGREFESLRARHFPVGLNRPALVDVSEFAARPCS